MTQKRDTIVLGLTGGIACGKSTAGKFFEELGWKVISTDQIVAEFLQFETGVIAEIRNRWGDKVWKDSSLDLKEVGKIVFSEIEERKWLEGILHPKVRKQWENYLEQSNSEKNIVEIPLLFENDLAEKFDYTICVYASLKTQMKRLLDRGLTKEESHDRIKAQLPIETKSQLADIVLLGENSLPLLKRQVSSLHEKINSTR